MKGTINRGSLIHSLCSKQWLVTSVYLGNAPGTCFTALLRNALLTYFKNPHFVLSVPWILVMHSCTSATTANLQGLLSPLEHSLRAIGIRSLTPAWATTGNQLSTATVHLFYGIINERKYCLVGSTKGLFTYVSQCHGERRSEHLCYVFGQIPLFFLGKKETF